jgi:hypothetical protein
MSLRVHIEEMQHGEIFATQSVLYFGTRKSVDNMIYKIINEGKLERLAWGVFRRLHEDGPPLERPPDETIARIKAEAFRRGICHCVNEPVNERHAEKFGIKPQHPTFCIHAYTSSFWYNGKRVFLIGRSAKKMRWCETDIGHMLWKLANIGRELCNTEKVQQALRDLNRVPTWMEISRYALLAPAWMWHHLMVAYGSV